MNGKGISESKDESTSSGDVASAASPSKRSSFRNSRLGSFFYEHTPHIHSKERRQSAAATNAHEQLAKDHKKLKTVCEDLEKRVQQLQQVTAATPPFYSQLSCCWPAVAMAPDRLHVSCVCPMFADP
jgi:hypothetical protein